MLSDFRARLRAPFVMVTGLVMGIAGTILAAPASATDTVRWVSPTGKGSTCSAAKPCSLATAQAKVRAAVPRMTGDLVVRLRGGTYSLSTPLTFGAADSGANGHIVRYEAAPGAKAVISGARRITGWKLHNRKKNIWRASIPKSFSSRQMWVNGVRARIASKPVASVLGNLRRTSTGYTISKSGIASWRNKTDAELVFPAGGHDPQGGQPSYAPWSWSMCGVRSATRTAVTVDTACFKNALGPIDKATGQPLFPFISKPTRLQNSKTLLGARGEFYLDDPANKVYYVPRAGEKMKTAKVLMPRVKALVSATGVHDLQIVGLTFEHATWKPNATLGVVDIQANVLAASPNYLTTVDPPLATIPAALSFKRARNVVLAGNVVRRVGGAGIAFTGGGQSNVVSGNVVSDASAGGINIGDGTGMYVPASYEVDTRVADNVVKNVAVEYQGGVGIFAGWVKGTHIEHNDVSHLPYTGISLGWGWASPSEMVDNHIDGNRVHHVMGSTLQDGGAIYVLGGQGSAKPSTISNNHVAEDPKPYGALYLDSGASNFRVTGNVVEKIGTGWIFLQNMQSGRASSNLVTSNWSDTAQQIPAIEGLHESNRLISNLLGQRTLTTQAKNVVAAAGPRDGS